MREMLPQFFRATRCFLVRIAPTFSRPSLDERRRTSAVGVAAALDAGARRGACARADPGDRTRARRPRWTGVARGRVGRRAVPRRAQG